MVSRPERAHVVALEVVRQDDPSAAAGETQPGEAEQLLPAAEGTIRARDGPLDPAAGTPVTAQVPEIQLVQRGGIRERQLALLQRGDEQGRSVLRDATQLLLRTVQVPDRAAVVVLVMRNDETLRQPLQLGGVERERPELVVACECSRISHGDLLFSHRGQIVELDDRVRLRPDAELPGILERGIVIIDHFLAVQEHLDVVAHHLHCQVVPYARGHLAVPARELHAAAVHGVVEVDVVLQRVGARDVIIVRVFQPPDDPAALVDLSAERLALDREPQVFQLGTGVGNGETVVGVIAVGLHQDVLAARRIVDGLHDPLARFALAGQPELELFRWLARGIRLEVEDGHPHLLLTQGRGAEQRAGQDECAFRHESSPRPRSGRLRLKSSYRSSSIALARARRASSSRCAIAIALTSCANPGVSGRPYASTFRSMSWIVSAIGRSAASVISKLRSNTSNVHSSPLCVYSPSNMSKRNSPGLCRYSRALTNLNFASGSMKRWMSQALAIRSTWMPVRVTHVRPRGLSGTSAFSSGFGSGRARRSTSSCNRPSTGSRERPWKKSIAAISPTRFCRRISAGSSSPRFSSDTSPFFGRRRASSRASPAISW